jgi:hypothetical protein
VQNDLTSGAGMRRAILGAPHWAGTYDGECEQSYLNIIHGFRKVREKNRVKPEQKE